jgi:hypothetical protein
MNSGSQSLLFNHWNGEFPNGVAKLLDWLKLSYEATTLFANRYSVKIQWLYTIQTTSISQMFAVFRPQPHSPTKDCFCEVWRIQCN